MSRAAPRRAALALALALAAGGCSVSGEGAHTIELHATSPVLHGRDILVEVVQHGALEKHRVTFTISLDANAVARVDSDGSRALVRLPTDDVANGAHRVGVKTGTERASIRIQVWPLWTAAAALVVIAASLAGAIVWGRRRRLES